MAVGTPQKRGEKDFGREVQELAGKGGEAGEEAEYLSTRKELEEFIMELQKKILPELEQAVEDFCQEEEEAAKAAATK